MSSKIKLMYDALYKDNPAIFGNGSLVFLKAVLDTNEVVRGKALDIGAGEGRTSAFLAEAGFVVDAVDVSDEAFKLSTQNQQITFHHTSINEFEVEQQYTLVNLALVAHHILEEDMVSVIKNLQSHTEPEGVHVYRLFTTNGSFFKQSAGRGFYDNFKNLNDLYEGWEVVCDELRTSQAATQDVTNELREVVFRKK